MDRTKLEVKIFGRPEILYVDDVDLENNLIEATADNLDVVWLYNEDGKLFYKTEYITIELNEDEIRLLEKGECAEDVETFITNIIRDKVCSILD